MTISLRKFRASIYWYVDLGVDGRSDPAYIKQVSSKADGAWWCSRSIPDGHEVLLGTKPEYRVEGKLGFSIGAPLQAPEGSHVAIFMEDTQEIFFVRAVLRREHGQWERQVQVELQHDSILIAEYSSGEYVVTGSIGGPG